TTSAGEGADPVTTDASAHGGDTRTTRRAHTDVTFLLDRFTLVGKTNDNKLVLDLLSTKEKSLVGALLRAATYYFSDLEVACVGTNAWVGWTPNGSPVLTEVGDNPVVFSRRGTTRFALPYTAPHRVLATVYNGDCKYKPTGTAPRENIRGDLATLAARIASETHIPTTFNYGMIYTQAEVDVYLRMKRAELYCPRPVLTHYDHNGRDRYKTTLVKPAKQ
nr:Chain 1, Polyprotein [Foot-and-mouth disease virus SAT 1]